jgi:hypothetical protein
MIVKTGPRPVRSTGTTANRFSRACTTVVLVAGLAFVDFVPSKSIVTAPRLDHVGEVEKSWPGE